MAFRPSAPHSFNPVAQQHAFRGNPTFAFWAGLCLLTASAFLFAVVALGLAGLVSRDPGAEEPLSLIGFGIFSAWLGVRSFRMGVYVTPGVLRVNNWFLTRTVTTAQISAINLVVRERSYDAGTEWKWVPLVELKDGTSFWISGLECGTARTPKYGAMMPEPDKVRLVNEVRHLLKVGGS